MEHCEKSLDRYADNMKHAAYFKIILIVSIILFVNHQKILFHIYMWLII